MLKPRILAKLLQQGVDEHVSFVMLALVIHGLRIYFVLSIIKECGSILSFAGGNQNEAITYATAASNIWQSYPPSTQLERLMADAEVSNEESWLFQFS